MNYTGEDYQNMDEGSVCYRLDCIREQLDTLIALLTPKAEPKPAEPITVQVVLDGKTISECVIQGFANRAGSTTGEPGRSGLLPSGGLL